MQELGAVHSHPQADASLPYSRRGSSRDDPLEQQAEELRVLERRRGRPPQPKRGDRNLNGRYHSRRGTADWVRRHLFDGAPPAQPPGRPPQLRGPSGRSRHRGGNHHPVDRAPYLRDCRRDDAHLRYALHHQLHCMVKMHRLAAAHAAIHRSSSRSTCAGLPSGLRRRALAA